MVGRRRRSILGHIECACLALARCSRRCASRLCDIGHQEQTILERVFSHIKDYQLQPVNLPQWFSNVNAPSPSSPAHLPSSRRLRLELFSHQHITSILLPRSQHLRNCLRGHESDTETTDPTRARCIVSVVSQGGVYN